MSKKNFYIFNNFIYWTNLGNRPFGHEQGLIEQIRTIDKRRIYSKLFMNKKHATITEDIG